MAANSPSVAALAGAGWALEGRLQFETFLSNLAARLLSATPEEMDDAIQASMIDLGRFLGSERGGVALFSEDGLSLMFNYGYFASGASTTFYQTDLARALPWYAGELRAGRPVIVRRAPEGIPPDAAAELALVAALGLKSTIALPLTAGGEVLGAVGADHYATYCSWPVDLVSRMDVLASIYANALYRRRARERLLRAADLNRSVLASVSSEIVVLDGAGRIVAVNEAWTRSFRRRRHPQAALGVGGDYFEAIARPAGGEEPAAEILAGLRAVLAGEARPFEGRYSYTDTGESRTYQLTVSPLSSGAGGAVVVYTDVSDLVETRAELEASLRDVRGLKERLEAENVVLQQQVRRAAGFDELVGTSASLGGVLAQVEQVAQTDAPVLLLGETGTGKDLVAHALHERSRRRERPLVIVNCAALPSGLVESELFGREKGAFTGALTRQIGRFEVADGSTLFLDEIGELSLEVQAKLLRVLETGEFERLGSPRTIKVAVRVIAATNRDLAEEIRQRRFREDLYYRLNVFPIRVPPLRERADDIPLLVWAFLEKFSSRMGKKITQVPRKTMEALQRHPWPGNVRELRNVIEHGAILATDDTLRVPMLEVAAPRAAPHSTLADSERELILRALESTGWHIKGPKGAAASLGLKPSTLYSRMKKLGIQPPGPAKDGPA